MSYQNLQHEFDVIQSDVKIKQKMQEEFRAESIKEEEKRIEAISSYLYFNTNVILTVENVIKATYANPDRKNFEYCSGLENWPLCPDNINADALIKKIAMEIPAAHAQFNQQKIQSFDTSKLYAVVVKTQWLADLKSLRWYGPYQQGENVYLFQTATDQGNFEGFVLRVNLDSYKLIQLFFFGKNGKQCGKYYRFDNK